MSVNEHLHLSDGFDGIINVLDNELIRAATTPEDEPQWVEPEGSEWILAVDAAGSIQVLAWPMIHDSFFESGYGAYELGLPEEWDIEPGVYWCKCSITYSREWETQHIDDWEFEIIEHRVLYQPGKDWYDGKPKE